MARGAGIEEEMENTKNMASLLMPMSCGDHHEQQSEVRSSAKKPGAVGGGCGREFECKTCSRRFPTFQALGGHRTSHNRPRVRGSGCNEMQVLKLRPKLHACPVCGLAFPMGQALGGHMRRHKLAAADLQAAKRASARELLWLDLNLPPLENELQLRSVGSGLVGEETASHEFSSCSSYTAYSA